MSARPTRTPSTLNNTRSSVASSSKKELNGGWFDVQLKTISHHVAEKENATAAKVKVNGKVIVVQNEAWNTSITVKAVKITALIILLLENLIL